MTNLDPADGLRIAIVGATGLVGRELVRLLKERHWPLSDLRLFASRRTKMDLDGASYQIQSLDVDKLRDCDVVFLAATADVSRDIVPQLAGNDALIIDNSSAYRLDAATPLVVPEVNPECLAGNLIANPNCSTILLLLALAPLHRAFTCRHVNVCTYQAVSGAGAGAVAALIEDTRLYLAADESGESERRDASFASRAFNVWSHESPIDLETGVNGEEAKMISEMQKMLGDGPAASVTCVRVPAERAHAEAVSVQFESPVAESDVRRVLQSAPGVSVIDDRVTGTFPTSRMASGEDDVFVGRIRIDACGLNADGRSDRYQFWLAGDQIRKGAALNAIQIGELHTRISARLMVRSLGTRQTPTEVF